MRLLPWRNKRGKNSPEIKKGLQLFWLQPLSYSGAETRNRTRDTRIFSPLLYQLSYLGRKGENIENPCPCQEFFLPLQINDPAACQFIVPGGMILIHRGPQKTRPQRHHGQEIADQPQK